MFKSNEAKMTQQEAVFVLRSFTTESVMAEVSEWWFESDGYRTIYRVSLSVGGEYYFGSSHDSFEDAIGVVLQDISRSRCL